MTSKSEAQTKDTGYLFRARTPMLWVVTREEGRVEPCIFEAARAANYIARTWDVAQGFADISGKPMVANPAQALTDPGAAINLIAERARGLSNPDRCVWIMRDMGPWLSGAGGAITVRQLKNLVRMLPGVEPDNSQLIVVLSTNRDVPPDLAGLTTVVNWPLPDRAEIEDILQTTIESLDEDLQAKALNGSRDAAIDAAVGLSEVEAQACYAKSLVQTKRIDVAAVTAEKKRVIERDGLLQWHDPLPGGLDSVGGLGNLKSWLLTRLCAYTPAARAYGLPAPRGIFLCGISGCGKTFTGKAIATALQCALIRLDPNALKSKYVGESEQRLRQAFDQIGAMGKVVVLIDEIEKALQGATSGSADGGVSADTLGALLTWMQERSGEAFIVATANDVSSLPPEMLRKGRWDELWFVDLPNSTERVEILKSALRQYGRDSEKSSIDFAKVANVTDGFSGAELTALVPEAMFTAYNDGAREITTADLLAARKDTQPLSKTAAKKIEDMRLMVKEGRARAASAAEVTDLPAVKAGRRIEV